MMINIIARCIGRDQRHVMEWRHQDATIQCGEVEVAIQFGIDGRCGLATIPWWCGSEPIFGPATKPLDMPWQIEFVDHLIDTCFEVFG